MPSCARSAPDSLDGLLEDLFETVTLWDVRAERATAEATGTGEYQVTLTVGAKKVRANSIGNETEVPMDEWVEMVSSLLARAMSSASRST